MCLAREDLSSYVEGEALVSNDTPAICQFILRDIIARHGMFTRMRADNGELDAKAAVDFFARMRIKLKLTSTYNPEGMGKLKEGIRPLSLPLLRHVMVT